jgi:HEAT repeat protein
VDQLTHIREELLAELESPEPELRRKAIACLASLRAAGPALEALLRVATSDPEPELRQEARLALESLQSDERRGPVPLGPEDDPVESLDAAEPGVRLAACLAVADGKRTDALPAVLRRLASEEDAWVKAALASAVGALGGPSEVAAVRPLLSDPDPRVVANAIDAIDAIGEELSFTLVMPFLSSPHHRVKASALRAVYRLDRDQALRTLELMLRSPNPAMRAGAAWCARSLPAKEAEPLLCEALGRETDGVALGRLVAMLVRVGSHRALGALAWAAANESDAARGGTVAAGLEQLRGRLGLSAAEVEQARSQFATDQASTIKLRRGQSSSANLLVSPPPPARRPARIAVAAAAIVALGLALVAPRLEDEETSQADPASGRPAHSVMTRLEGLRVERGRVSALAMASGTFALETAAGPLSVRSPARLISNLETGMLVEIEGRNCTPPAPAGCVEADTLRVLAR